MKEQDYQSSFITNISQKEAFEKIACVSEWWSKNCTGKSQGINEVFTVSFPSGDWYQAKVVEMLPDTKIVWELIDAYQVWVQQPTEWVGTRIIWEVTPQKDAVEVKMTHSGLVPELECFNTCSKGWHYLIQDSLFSLLNKGTGHPV